MYEKYDKETMEWRVDMMLSAAQKGQDLKEKLGLIYAMYQECSDKVYDEWRAPEEDYHIDHKRDWRLTRAKKAEAKAKKKAYTGPFLTDAQKLTLTDAQKSTRREAEDLLKRELSLLRKARNYNDAQ
tara:strand:+ start:259 stop:639 length:381 start_codon:yes stop_codon:yes gene_type:complete